MQIRTTRIDQAKMANSSRIRSNNNQLNCSINNSSLLQKQQLEQQQLLLENKRIIDDEASNRLIN